MVPARKQKGIKMRSFTISLVKDDLQSCLQDAEEGQGNRKGLEGTEEGKGHWKK